MLYGACCGDPVRLPFLHFRRKHSRLRRRTEFLSATPAAQQLGHRRAKYYKRRGTGGVPHPFLRRTLDISGLEGEQRLAVRSFKQM